MTSSIISGVDPHLFTPDVAAAIAFYARTFGAVEVFRNVLPDGRVLFVELAFGPGRLLLSQTLPGLDSSSTAPTGVPMLLHVDVEDPEETARRAVFHGATVEQPVAEQFWGERYGILCDPFGFRWSISTARQSLPPEEMKRRTPRYLRDPSSEVDDQRRRT